MHVVTCVQTRGAARTTGDQLSALLDARLDEGLDLIELGFADHGPQTGPGIAGIAHWDGLGGRLGNGDRFGLSRPGYKHARGGVAGLAGIAHATQHAAANGAFQIRILQDDIGRLAPQLLSHPFDRVRGCLGDQHPGPGGARERHHVDIGMGG